MSLLILIALCSNEVTIMTIDAPITERLSRSSILLLYDCRNAQTITTKPINPVNDRIHMRLGGRVTSWITKTEANRTRTYWCSASVEANQKNELWGILSDPKYIATRIIRYMSIRLFRI